MSYGCQGKLDGFTSTVRFKFQRKKQSLLRTRALPYIKEVKIIQASIIASDL
jgi:hypothetical protein